MAKIERLFVAVADRSGREEREELLCDLRGIVGDKFYGKKSERSVLITGRAAYELAARQGIVLKEGDLGENILLDLDPRELEEGCVVRIGEVELVMTRRCPICEHLAVYDPSLPRLVRELRGVYLSVRKGGRIDRKMPVEILPPVRKRRNG
jgi:MOSC domain-containing protein YiiM